jgi:hypothetical protein
MRRRSVHSRASLGGTRRKSAAVAGASAKVSDGALVGSMAQ